MQTNVVGIPGENSNLTKNDAFPARLPRGEYPDQPPTEGGRLPSTLENVRHLLAESDVEVRYDVIKKRLAIKRKEKDLSHATLDSLANLNGLQSQFLGSFVQEIGQQNPVNPVRTWIESLPWDGTKRLPLFCETVEVDEDFPNELKDKLIQRWLYSAVAAAKKWDGFKARGVLTLQGEQGIGKTSWIAALVPPELRNDFVKLDHHLDPNNKDSVFIGVSHWITEVGELDSSFKKDVARLKGFLTNDCDKLRLPYDKRPIEMPRRTVFAASVNDPNFLIDRTGNSRFWTLPVLSLDYEHDVNMQQLYAEIALMIEEGATWWLTPEEEAELEESNKRFRAVSVIEERLLEHLSDNEAQAKYRTAMQVLQAVGMNYPSNPQCREAGQILRSRYGPPKRVQGRDCWKVALVEESGWPKPTHVDEDDDY